MTTHLDVLVNDAGIFPKASVLDMSPDDFDRVVVVDGGRLLR